MALNIQVLSYVLWCATNSLIEVDNEIRIWISLKIQLSILLLKGTNGALFPQNPMYSDERCNISSSNQRASGKRFHSLETQLSKYLHQRECIQSPLYTNPHFTWHNIIQGGWDLPKQSFLSWQIVIASLKCKRGLETWISLIS